MKIEYKTKKIKRECENPGIAKKDFGSVIGNKLTQRINELIAASSLLDIQRIPAAGLHRLEGPRSNQYSIYLVHPFRLVIKPIVDSKDDINKLENIKIIRIEEVTDYHGKQ